MLGHATRDLSNCTFLSQSSKIREACVNALLSQGTAEIRLSPPARTAVLEGGSEVEGVSLQNGLRDNNTERAWCTGRRAP